MTEALDEVRNYLSITWEDEATDRKLLGVIERASAVICGYIGAEVDLYGGEYPQEKQLFLDCVRYIYNNAYEDFSVNFASEITALRAKHAVIAAEKGEENAERTA